MHNKHKKGGGRDEVERSIRAIVSSYPATININTANKQKLGDVRSCDATWRLGDATRCDLATELGDATCMDPVGLTYHIILL